MLGDIAARHPDIAWVIVTGDLFISVSLRHRFYDYQPDLGQEIQELTFFLTFLPCPYFTGDLPAHDVWMQSQDTNIHVAKVFFPQIQNSQFQIETNRY